MSVDTHLSPVGNEIQRLLDGRSQDWLSEQSGVSQATISRIMRGAHKEPSKQVSALDAIARALGVDPSYLMYAAGVPVPPPDREIDPEVEYISKRLYELPSHLRSEAVDTLGSVLDSIYKVAGLRERTAAEEMREVADETVPEAEEFRNEERARRRRP